MSKSWNESFFGSNPGPSPPVVQSSYSSAGSGNNRVGQRSRRPTFSRVPPPRTVTTVAEKRLVFKEEMMLAEGR